MAKKTVGRPPKYKSKEQIESLIEQYFKDCEGEILKDTEGNPILNKWGIQLSSTRGRQQSRAWRLRWGLRADRHC